MGHDLPDPLCAKPIVRGGRRWGILSRARVVPLLTAFYAFGGATLGAGLNNIVVGLPAAGLAMVIGTELIRLRHNQRLRTADA